jgi:hypothetical protein
MALFQIVVLLISLIFSLLVVPTTQALKPPFTPSSQIKVEASSDVKMQRCDSEFETVTRLLAKIQDKQAEQSAALTDLKEKQAQQSTVLAT